MSTVEPLSRALVALYDFVTGQGSLEDTLGRIVTVTAESLAADVGGVTLFDASGRPATVGYTDPLVPEIDEAQYGPDTGPCLDAYARIRKAGGVATYHSLPSLPHNALYDQIPQSGIWGNDHIMMWNTNSDEIAGLLLKWIEQHVERKR